MSFSNTYNLVKKFAAFPCAEPDPFIIAITFLPAVAPALLEWATFSCRDVLKFRLGRDTPCGRALKGGVIKAIPPVLQSTAQNLLKFEARFSFAGQLWLLADLASDTIARWTTLSYQLSGCPDALNIASWDIEFQSPEGLLPNTPSVIGGRVTNDRNALGIAWTTGAIVPPGWYASGYFELDVRPVFGDAVTGLTTWIRRHDFNNYDYAGVKVAPGYQGQGAKGVYHIEVQNTDEHNAHQLSMYAMTDAWCLTTALTAHWMAAPFPLTTNIVKPLSCLDGLFNSHVDNPAGQNQRGRQPTFIPKWLGPDVAKPVRGPPGGKPRSKN